MVHSERGAFSDGGGLKVDKNTFSDSKAAQRLVAILGEPDYSQYAGKARKILSKFFQYSSAVMSIQDDTIRKGTLEVWRRHFLAWVSVTNFPEIVETHLSNALVTQYRKCIKQTRKRDFEKGTLATESDKRTSGESQ